MPVLTSLFSTLDQLPPEKLLIAVALGAMGLAAFAIHAVLVIAKRRGDH